MLASASPLHWMAPAAPQTTETQSCRMSCAIPPSSRGLAATEPIGPPRADHVSPSTTGLESSPVAAALAGMRAHEARYFKNNYDHVFTVEPAGNAKTTIDWVHWITPPSRAACCPDRGTPTFAQWRSYARVCKPRERERR